jgi:hypothetical protein
MALTRSDRLTSKDLLSCNSCIIVANISLIGISIVGVAPVEANIDIELKGETREAKEITRWIYHTLLIYCEQRTT